MMLRQQFLKAELPADMDRAAALERIRPAIEANGFRFRGAEAGFNAPAFVFQADDFALTLSIVNDGRYGLLYTFILDFELGWLRSTLAGGLPLHRFPEQIARDIAHQLRERGIRARPYALAKENDRDPV